MWLIHYLQNFSFSLSDVLLYTGEESSRQGQTRSILIKCYYIHICTTLKPYLISILVFLLIFTVHFEFFIQLNVALYSKQLKKWTQKCCLAKLYKVYSYVKTWREDLWVKNVSISKPPPTFTLHAVYIYSNLQHIMIHFKFHKKYVSSLSIIQILFKIFIIQALEYLRTEPSCPLRCIYIYFSTLDFDTSIRFYGHLFIRLQLFFVPILSVL